MKTNADSTGYYSFSGLDYHPKTFYELREVPEADNNQDTHLNNGYDCYQTNVNSSSVKNLIRDFLKTRKSQNLKNPTSFQPLYLENRLISLFLSPLYPSAFLAVPEFGAVLPGIPPVNKNTQ